MSGNGTPHLYLLEIDASFNLGTNDQLVSPLHMFNNSSDFSNQFLRVIPPIPPEDTGQQQTEVLIDTNEVNSLTAVNEEKDHTEQLSPILPFINSCNRLPKEIIEINEDQKNEIINRKQHVQQYVSLHIPDRIAQPRAFAVLPSILQIRKKVIIVPRRTLPARARFGPVEDIQTGHVRSTSFDIKRINIKISSNKERKQLVMNAEAAKTPIFVFRNCDKHMMHIDVSDKDKSNWIGLLPLGDDDTANLWIYEENSLLFAITTDAVPSRKQLMLGYSKKYAQDYGLIGATKDINIESPMKQKPWWCFECQRAFSSAIQLQTHKEAYHKDSTKKRRYRCRFCKRTFSRISTLRRHATRHCEMKVSKSANCISSEALPEPNLNTSLNSEENRLPSDESFQNYSNGLDFSTNLFDTDRMPSLDLSGNSRSEVFNPYVLEGENPLANDLYTNGCSNKSNVSPIKENKKKQHENNTEITLEECSYCKQNIVKGKNRLHVSECPARRFECECKKVFSNKQLLADHIYTQHNNASEVEEQKTNVENNSNPPTDNELYKCEQCQVNFKRRGMLVNHLWRVHSSEALVPLTRRVRHYPCGACPKLYRSAAKRDRHVSRHHPGAAQARARPMEGGTRVCTPAACPACPRQYATRAKLLQHQRGQHPHLNSSQTKREEKHPKNSTNDRLAASEALGKETSFQELLNFY